MTDTPSPSVRRSIPDVEAFLDSISPQDTIGPYLRYDAVYDEIRLCRQEDDPRLSMGIWQTDLKRADWAKIEDLCLNALLTKSKDLQIAIWLTEAWTALDGASGYTRGIQLLNRLSDTFWKDIYPQPQNDDMDNRSLLFEWMDTALSTRLSLLYITQSTHDQTSYGIGFYKSAQHSDALKSRQQNANTKATTDPSKAIGTIEEFQRSLNQTPESFLLNLSQYLEEAEQSTQILKNTLEPLLEATSPTFSQIFATLKEMQRVLKSALQGRVPPIKAESETTTELPVAQAVIQPQSTPQTPTNDNLNTRSAAYRQLEAIASFLEVNDPQNFAPKLLRQIIGWENKNVIDVLSEIAKTPEEYEIFMRLLGTKPS
jgi:type VI secretion system protein ImpA